jgi:uncharacterized protein with gpF-like domain
MAIDPKSLPFDEAIDFLRKKVSLPTERWTDLWEGQHARAFSVAGAARDDLLADLREAVKKAVAKGTTLAEFQKDFDALVQKSGWSYKGSRGWRTRVIYETNLRTSYQAGRYKQMTDPEVMQRRPYWQYVHGDSKNPRPEHLAWDGLVLPADDPWWETHYPPNGWGCKCKVLTLSPRELKKLGKDEPDSAPDNGSRLVEVPGRGLERVPNGIDPGWAYNVGEAAE